MRPNRWWCCLERRKDYCHKTRENWYPRWVQFTIGRMKTILAVQQREHWLPLWGVNHCVGGIQLILALRHRENQFTPWGANEILPQEGRRIIKLTFLHEANRKPISPWGGVRKITPTFAMTFAMRQKENLFCCEGAWPQGRPNIAVRGRGHKAKGILP